MMNLRVVNDMLVTENNEVYAKNFREYTDERGLKGYMAEGLHNWEMDENGDSHKVIEWAFTENCDMVKIY